jgi:hypothetical protein
MSGLAIANVVALIAGTGWLAKLTLPFSQAVRVRNAFLLRRGLPEDFNWTPSSIPSGFRIEHGRAPSVIDQAVRDNGLQNADQDWVRALGLVTMLVRHGRNEDAIRADLVTTYNGIVAGKGYCSDYVRVYLAAATGADLFCRQWAFSFDGFGGHGHTFVEVYDRQRARWLFVDVYNNVYAVLSGTDEPIDALTLRQALVTSPASIEFRRAGPGRLGFEHSHKLLDYYRRGASQWYLWWGNDVITRDTAGFGRVLSKVSGYVAHGVASAFGLPPILVVVTPENESQVARMQSLKQAVITAAILIILLALLLGIQLD